METGLKIFHTPIPEDGLEETAAFLEVHPQVEIHGSPPEHLALVKTCVGGEARTHRHKTLGIKPHGDGRIREHVDHHAKIRVTFLQGLQAGQGFREGFMHLA